ncbi:MAG TPA: CcdB family protein [Rhodopila sp.]|jgi:toxin CcdB|nr:CcdB family protein [Rhodopila sp.]
MQCDVHRNTDDRTGQIPYLLDVQADLLDDLQTRVVVPLIRADTFGRRADRLHPVFEVEGTKVVMATHLIAAIRRHALGTAVASVRDQRDLIVNAIDVLWSGV